MAQPRKFDHDEARRRHAAGESITAIARDLGVTRSAILRVVDPRCRERMHAASLRWYREHRELCKGGCGRLVWVAARPNASGYCQTCSGLQRQTAAHGTEARYKTGCRCGECRTAATAAKRRRREQSRQPCSHGCGRMVDTINRRDPGKPLECAPCAQQRVGRESSMRRREQAA